MSKNPTAEQQHETRAPLKRMAMYISPQQGGVLDQQQLDATEDSINQLTPDEALVLQAVIASRIPDANNGSINHNSLMPNSTRHLQQ